MPETMRVRTLVIGAGPAGVAAALRLNKSGNGDLLILDRFQRVGGISGQYAKSAKPTFIEWSKGRILHGPDYAARLDERLRKAGIEVRLKTSVLRFDLGTKTIEAVSSEHGCCRIMADVVLFACGARESTPVEHGRVFGTRPARVFHTLHLQQLLQRKIRLYPAKTAVVGSEVIAYATAAELAASTGTPCIIDSEYLPSSSVFSRLYFFRNGFPRRIGNVRHINVEGHAAVEGLRLEKTSPETIATNYLFFCGHLKPNTELLAMAGLPCHAETRLPEPETLRELEAQGVFIAGNISGSATGADFAYLNGYRTAGRVIDYLKRLTA